MPTPYVFSSKSELHQYLMSEDTKNFLRTFQGKRVDSIESVVSQSVAGNTFRAFHFRTFNINGSPSDFFRNWTSDYLNRNLSHITGLSSFMEMIDLVCQMAHELDNHWYQRSNQIDEVRIGFGRAAKLLGLALKHLIWLDTLSSNQRANLIKILNVPLDSYTLQGLRLISSDQRIPASATMKFVQNEGQYRALQLCIQNLMPNGSYPIDYEICAWNLAHPKVINSQR